MAKSDEKPLEIDQATRKTDINKSGFHLLKAGKDITDTKFKRSKDVVIIKEGKKETLKNINKKSYVPNSTIKMMGINLKHFENAVDKIPAEFLKKV